MAEGHVGRSIGIVRILRQSLDLFPNLRVLTIMILTHLNHATEFFADSFNGLALRDLTLRFDFIDIGSRGSEELLKPFASAVRKEHLSVKSFAFYGPVTGEYSDWTDQQEIVTALINDLSQLTRLHLENMGESFEQQWASASVIEGLHDVNVRVPRHEVLVGSSFSTGGFQALNSVSVGGVPLHARQAFLGSIASANLTQLTLEAEDCEVEGEIAEGHVDGVISDVLRWPALRTIDISFGGGITKWDDLLPLLHCRMLEELGLEFLGNAELLEDSHIISSSWQSHGQSYAGWRCGTTRSVVVIHHPRLFLASFS